MNFKFIKDNKRKLIYNFKNNSKKIRIVISKI